MSWMRLMRWIWMPLVLCACGISGNGGTDNPDPGKGTLELRNIEVSTLADSLAVIHWNTTQQAVCSVSYGKNASVLSFASLGVWVTFSIGRVNIAQRMTQHTRALFPTPDGPATSRLSEAGAAPGTSSLMGASPTDASFAATSVTLVVVAAAANTAGWAVTPLGRPVTVTASSPARPLRSILASISTMPP